ncbi:hypothetical protein HYV88_06145 [Candidatus Woesearchaeota archaeon]|nr:hypothetical protein [Candidatus Woesearchaeota archaeon]
MYKGPNDRHYDHVIELGLKFEKDGLKIPYYLLLRIMDSADVAAINSARGLCETIIDTCEDLVVV